MIIIGGSAVHPLYTRVIVSRSCLTAEFAVSRFSIVDQIQPSTEFFSPDYGRFRIDSVTRQGETYLIRAYDPLAYHAKYRVCRQQLGAETGVWHTENHMAATTLYNLINSQANHTTLADYKAQLAVAPSPDPGEITVTLDVRYDMLFDVYSQIVEAIDPSCRLSISNPASYTGNTVYTPEYSSEVPQVLTQPQIIDYSYHATMPDFAFVVGKGDGPQRPTQEVGTGKIETFVNVPFAVQAALSVMGRNAINSAKTEAENITVKMLTKHVPAGLKPADTIKFAFNPADLYRVQSIEYTTSPAGDIAYISCGGRVMSVADRINALIAADYAARY